MSKRERYAAIAAAAVLGILLLDQVLVTPLLARWSDADAQIQLAASDRERAARLIVTSKRANRTWDEMIGQQLRRDASEAESQVLNSVREWAQEAGMTLSSLKPERTEKEKDFHKITFRATGGGSMAQVARFLWRIETATVPVRVTDVTITSRKPGTDDLGVQLGIATSYLAAEPTERAARPTTETASRESIQ
jgi:ribosomal protein L22